MFVEIANDGTVTSIIRNKFYKKEVTQEIDDPAWSPPPLTDEDGNIIYDTEYIEKPDPHWVRPYKKDENGEILYRDIVIDTLDYSTVKTIVDENGVMTTTKPTVVKKVIGKEPILDMDAEPPMIRVPASMDKIRYDTSVPRPKIKKTEIIDVPIEETDTIKFIRDEDVPENFSKEYTQYIYKDGKLEKRQTNTIYIKDQLPLEDAIALKVNEINAIVANKIIGGFASSALGDTHYYQSDKEDQLNLIGAIATGVDQYFKCSPDNQNWEFKLHTNDELKVVINDGAAVKLHLLTIANDLKLRAKSASSIDELNAIDTVAEINK